MTGRNRGPAGLALLALGAALTGACTGTTIHYPLIVEEQHEESAACIEPTDEDLAGRFFIAIDNLSGCDERFYLYKLGSRVHYDHVNAGRPCGVTLAMLITSPVIDATVHLYERADGIEAAGIDTCQHRLSGVIEDFERGAYDVKLWNGIDRSLIADFPANL